MWVYVIVLNLLLLKIEALWDSDVVCPMVCTCRLEHLTETAIHRFLQKHNKNPLQTETDNHINNDVLYEENEFFEDNPLLRAVTCILQTETEPIELLQKLPNDIDLLILIQGAESGNKSVNSSMFEMFPQLLILELHGTNMVNEKYESNFFCNIDAPLPEIKYLNFEKILIKASKMQVGKIGKEVNDPVTFEYTQQQLDPNIHPLTMVQKTSKREILPYIKYVEEDKEETPLFIGFNSLVLLRISSCEMSNISWEMFDGLHNLEYLMLEKNNLKYIPDFAFYGTPHLKSLSLAWNKLPNIQITDLAGLLELEHLDLSHNNFSQLSELSFPPFPMLKLANFGNNPISAVFPSTFEVMNTTDSLIIGGEEMPLTLITNSFLGLKMLKKLTLQNLMVPLLKRDLLMGMPILNELIMTGNISKIEFDAFLDMPKLQKLIIARCTLKNISMDGFFGLAKLEILDLSQNILQYLHPGTFDPLKNLKELYLNDNKFQQLPREVFYHTHAKLIRLTENPWHCSCKMSDWKPMIINKVKHKSAKTCDFTLDKGLSCGTSASYNIKYVFDTRVAPKCLTPKKYKNWSVFHVMRKQLKCLDYKPKIKKRINYSTIKPEKNNTSGRNVKYNELFIKKMRKLETKNKIHDYQEKLNQDVPVKISLFSSHISTNNDENNDLNFLHTNYYPPLNLQLQSNEHFSINVTNYLNGGKLKKQPENSTHDAQ